MTQKLVINTVAYGLSHQYQATLSAEDELDATQMREAVDLLGESLAKQNAFLIEDDTLGWVAIGPRFIRHAYIDDDTRKKGR